MSAEKKIAQIEVGLPVGGPFDYAVPEALRGLVRVGQRVRVLFNRRSMAGYVVGLKATSEFQRLSHVLSILDETPTLTPPILELTNWMVDAYGCFRGEAIQTCLPAALRKMRRTALQREHPSTTPSQSPRLRFLHAPCREDFPELLKDTLQRHLSQGHGILILVPETAYLSTLVSWLKQEWDIIPAVMAGVQTPKQELDVWQRSYNGEASVLIGTRSAVFAPHPALKCIVIFDEENSSYKEEQSPYYRAAGIAHARARLQSLEVLHVSQAPSAEMWYEAHRAPWQWESHCPDKYSPMQLVDLSNYNAQKSSWISVPVQNRMEEIVKQGGRVLFLMNRTGYAMRTQCNECGHALMCPRCASGLVYMTSKDQLLCRHCSYHTPLPRICPACRGKYVRSIGTGIEKLVENVSRFHAAYGIVAVDKETVELPENKQIVIATQAVLKFRMHQRFDMVAVLNFDAELGRMDFRAAQRAFTLLVSLRMMARHQFVVQTRLLDNYCLQAMTREGIDFARFYREELALRRELGLPPYQDLVSIGLRGPDEEVVWKQAQVFYERLQQSDEEGLQVMDPNPDGIAKMRDKYRYSIMCSGSSLPRVVQVCKKAIKDSPRKRGVIVSVNADP